MSSQSKSIYVSAPSSSSGLVSPIPPPPSFQKKNDNQQKKTIPVGFSGSGISASTPVLVSNDEILKELEKAKGSKKPVEVTTPLQPRILDFNYSGSSEIHKGDFLPMQTGITTVGPTPEVRVTTSQDLGFTPGSSFRDPDIGNIFNQFSNTNESVQDTGITPSMAKELMKLREMISSVPGVVQPIPEISSSSHRISRFAPPICDAEIPKRFKTPNMKLYDGTTDHEEHAAQYRESMEINPIPLDLKEACLCKGFGSTLTGSTLKWLLNVPPYSISSFAHLINLFNNQFSCSRTFERLTSDLYRITQNPGESLRDYVNKFDVPTSYNHPNRKAESTPFKLYRSKPYSKPENHRVNAVEDDEEEEYPKLSEYFFSLDTTSLLYAMQNLGDKARWPRKFEKNTGWKDKSKCKGYLKEFLGKGKNKTKDHDRIPQRAKSQPPDAKVKGFISGGSDICGRPWIHDMKAVPLTYHQCVKMPTPWGVVKINSDQQDAKDCYTSSMKASTKTRQAYQLKKEARDVLETKEQDVKEVSLSTEDPDVKVLVGTNIPKDIEQNLIELLKIRTSTFAWKHEDTTGQYTKRGESLHPKGMQLERLLKVGMIREVKFPRWLANVVVVQKTNGKWRVCVDFTDLNKACPKYPFPLLHIDSMVDATPGHEMLTFMDASSGLQQIEMEPSDQEDTAFMTPTCIYCYIAMPFGLKNAGATYQRLVNMMFKEKLGDSIREQIKVIINLKSPANTKDVQRLTDRVAALNQFISRSSERCKEFYDILKKIKMFEWEEKHEEALQSLKEYLLTTPLLMKPEDDGPLSLYLAVSENSVSAVLVKDHEGQQHPETKYSHLENLILALIMTSTKLRHYFETHVIYVKTNYPIKCVLKKPEMSGRMAKWSVKLSAYDLIYEPRTTIKYQALADFVADFSSDIHHEADLEVQQLEKSKDKWTLFTDDASNVRGTCLGFILKSLQGDIIPQSISCEFQATDNEIEYEALIAGLQLAWDMKICQVYVDSWLIANHFNGSYAVKGEKLAKYLTIAKQLSVEFKLFNITKVPREDNIEADALANLASALKIPEGIKIPIIHILSPAIEKKKEVSNTEEEADVQNVEPSQGSWILLIKKYLQNGEIPSPYLRCLEDPEALEVFKDIHEVGKFSKAPEGKFFMLAMTDYFSKWIEAEAFVQVREKVVISFIKRNILTRFGIPAEIVCDNGSQFISKRTTNFCASWGIKMITSTPVHPQANGQVEFSNKIIINYLKKRLGAKKGRWAEELPFTLWADRTTTKNATGQTPFSLVFGTEAMIHIEMVIPTARTNIQTPETNNEALAHDLDTVDELKYLAKVRIAAYQQRIAKSYNKNIRIRRFQVGDLLLRKAFQNTTNPSDRKLEPKWEDPYLIDSETGKGAYWLATMEGDILPRSWNAIHIKTYFM
ncbi:hypothetical protein L1987_30367 [Smallanthus sonchifolius]|uniref:Uncharacterized protein n=1 Tax=Smallanthus sonchifolius TaxID=185202 RepID=A0ACB9I2E9_9ASTR|nr:hypothetical protein L1987_30367 [Smallanthus sonchifolius]